MSILVINTGSSTLKFALFDSDGVQERARGKIDWKKQGQPATLVLKQADAAPLERQASVPDYAAAVHAGLQLLTDAGLVSSAQPIRCCGHRVVHGGTEFRESVRVDARVKETIGRLAELAPLHNPPALAAIEAAQSALPDVPHVAVFDTAFFADLPPEAYVYPLPYEWLTDWGIRRFGFHGISHAYCAGRAAELLGRQPDDLRLVICHLGNGCSATAVRGGRAMAHSMGFTPLDGLMMGTRPGSIDPGILVHVARRHGVSADELDNILNHRSGLLGVSGVSGDYRQVEAAAQNGNERARLALTIYADRVRATIGGLTVTLGGLDALVFTAGVGENSASLRAAVCRGLECLGVFLDGTRNEQCRPDSDVAAEHSRARILVIETREEALIARETRRRVEAAA